jgi:hypothetical protein
MTLPLRSLIQAKNHNDADKAFHIQDFLDGLIGSAISGSANKLSSGLVAY